MKKNNMGKLLGVALVVAIMCTGLFYMMFAMKANSQTGTTMVVAAKALKAGTVLKADGSQDHSLAGSAASSGRPSRPEGGHWEYGIRPHGARRTGAERAPGIRRNRVAERACRWECGRSRFT